MTAATATGVGPSSRQSSRCTSLPHNLDYIFSAAPDWQPIFPTSVMSVIVPRTNATYGGTAPMQRAPADSLAVDRTPIHSLLERIVRVWALENDGADRLATLLDSDAAAASNLATATDLLVHYLKQDRIAGVVRRPVPEIDGATLLDVLFSGDSHQVLNVCQEMFRFDNVHT